MNCRILITGSEGLAGTALRSRLETRGAEITGLDLRGRGDVRGARCVRDAARGCHGIVHLAAVSRVEWGKRNPIACWDVNTAASATAPSGRPWLVFASSREVYGRTRRLPAAEDTPLRPINVYGRSKVEGERLVEAARNVGILDRRAAGRPRDEYPQPVAVRASSRA